MDVGGHDFFSKNFRDKKLKFFEIHGAVGSLGYSSPQKVYTYLYMCIVI